MEGYDRKGVFVPKPLTSQLAQGKTKTLLKHHRILVPHDNLLPININLLEILNCKIIISKDGLLKHDFATK